MANSKLTLLNPTDLHPTSGYHHITIAPAARYAFLSGQCPLDGDENVVGVDDVDAQVDKVAENTLIALEAAGARPGDVVRTVLYVASADSEVLARAWHRLAEESVIAEAFGTASTLLGVSVLGYPGQLVELDVTALLTDE